MSLNNTLTDTINASHTSSVNVSHILNIKSKNFFESYNPLFRTHLFFCILLLLDFLLLFFMVSEISIYSKEAEEFFENNKFSYHLANLGVTYINYFFQDPLLNDYGLRLPFIFIHICSCIVMYNIGLLVLTKPNDALLCVLIFMMIPGINLEALIVSNVEIITLVSLMLVYYQLRFNRILYAPLIFVIFLDSGGAILCLALFFYALFHRKPKTLVFSVICFGINMSIFTPISGVPHSYFLDIIGLLAILFTPILFVYYVAILYNYTFHNKPTLLNLIPFIGFIFIFLLSTRQQIRIESFLPELSVGLPLFVQKVLFNIRCRLPQFRSRYVLRLCLVVIFLLLGDIILFGNKITYYFVKNKNFAYSFYGAKEIAKQLYAQGITSIEIPHHELNLRLKFYGINAKESETRPALKLIQANYGKIHVEYCGMIIAQYAIVKNQ
ncbi:hypothetical protein CQA53_02950 [Helicobacter didelphidarum]|uniref:Glycosyltransferase RgtA/B/C/D-like domain-containing protein n=1 Tax=Helicobacter didelphidarum TaxID=2040648 RepID=A0A3D8INQ5_9HELI|nr:hypothetical protein [Helicobacter didelphidarum]RDU66743.1 hypothetical protein CQA53_02950 [Helicobacter didelphidarum]